MTSMISGRSRTCFDASATFRDDATPNVTISCVGSYYKGSDRDE